MNKIKIWPRITRSTSYIISAGLVRSVEFSAILSTKMELCKHHGWITSLVLLWYFKTLSVCAVTVPKWYRGRKIQTIWSFVAGLEHQFTKIVEQSMTPQTEVVLHWEYHECLSLMASKRTIHGRITIIKYTSPWMGFGRPVRCVTIFQFIVLALLD